MNHLHAEPVHRMVELCGTEEAELKEKLSLEIPFFNERQRLPLLAAKTRACVDAARGLGMAVALAVRARPAMAASHTGCTFSWAACRRANPTNMVTLAQWQTKAILIIHVSGLPPCVIAHQRSRSEPVTKNSSRKVPFSSTRVA